MKATSQLLISLILGTVFVSCGAKQTADLKGVDSVVLPDLIVGSSGWFTCRKNSPKHSVVFKRLKTLVDNWPTSNKPTVVVNCFNVHGHLRYATLDDEKIYEAEEPVQFTSFLSSIQDQVGDRVSLVGHSYGGWLMMKVALRLSFDKTILSLNTIDAISYENCHYSNILRNESCHRAPDDLNERDYEDIDAAVGFWRNDFQRRSWLLRSNVIPQADENHEHAQNDFYRLSFSAHQDLDNKRDVWREIASVTSSVNPWLAESP